MRLVAAACSALVVALFVGWLSGAFPAPKRLRPVRPQRGLWLIQSGIGITRAKYFGLMLGTGTLSLGLTWAISGLLAVALPAALVIALLPRAWLLRRRAERLAELQRAWPDGLRDLIASISSGMSLGRALETLAGSGPAPLRAAFARFPLLARTAGVAAGLEAIKRELADPTSDRVIEVLIVAHSKGGSIVVEILRDLATATTRDLWANEEMESLALEQKINARVVFAIPWLVLAFITIRPGPFRDFYASGSGWLVVAIGAMASFFGIWLASRLSREAPEPRVFGGVQ